MTNINTLRNLNYTIRKSHLVKIKDEQPFKDMVQFLGTSCYFGKLLAQWPNGGIFLQ